MPKKNNSTQVGGGAFVISEWAFDLFQDDLETAKILDKLAYLSRKLANREGFFYRSKDDLRGDIRAGMHESTLTRKLRVLEKCGFIDRRLNRGHPNYYRVEWEAIGEACRERGIRWNEPSRHASPQDEGRQNALGTEDPDQNGGTPSVEYPSQNDRQYVTPTELPTIEPRRTLVPMDPEPLAGSCGSRSGVTSERKPGGGVGKEKTGRHKGRKRSNGRTATESPQVSDPGRAPEDRSYDWKHYEAIDWQRAEEEGILPDRESRPSLLLGAFILSLWTNQKIRLVLDAGDFNGKLGKNAKDCLGHFRKRNDGDELAGFREALGWVRWFTSQPEDSFIGGAGWPIGLCFSKAEYRQSESRMAAGRNKNQVASLQRNSQAGVLYDFDASQVSGTAF